MRIAHRSRLWVEGGDLQDLALLHAEWALGLLRFAELRDARLAAGMPATLQPDDIAGVFLKIATPEPGAVLRTSVVRLAEERGGVKVEHMVVRDGGNYRLNPSAEAPEIVLRLLADTRTDARELGTGVPIRVAEDEVAKLVANACSPARREPIVLISVDNATRAPIIDAGELARRLAGMSAVYWLDAVRTSHRLREELIDAGFSEKFGCYNGGVRILWPGIVPGDDPYGHTLLLPVRLHGFPERSRTEQVAGTFCEMIAEDDDPRAWLREPDERAPTPARSQRAPAPAPARAPVARPRPAPEPDAPRPSAPAPTKLAPEPKPSRTAEPSRTAAAIAELPRAAELPVDPPTPTPCEAPRLEVVEPAPVEAPPVEAPPIGASTAEAREPAVPDVPTPVLAPVSAPVEEAAPTPARPQPSEPRPAAQPGNTWTTLAADVTAAFELAAELERDLDATRNELVSARQQLRRAEQQRDELAEGGSTIEDAADAVKLAAALFTDRLVVLPSAHASALDSVYRDAEKCFRVLVVLAMFGQHDGTFAETLAKALGHAAEWKPKDSPSTIAKFGAQRTWTSSTGERHLYSRHVTLGGSVNPQRCLQIYYDVLADGRVEIAWVGEHRPTVGKDT